MESICFDRLAGFNYRFAYSIRVLLEKGANVNAQDDDGNTALIHTVKNKSDHSLELVELLIEKGANSSIKTRKAKSLLIIMTLAALKFKSF
jgi:ankyrin repeat protein